MGEEITDENFVGKLKEYTILRYALLEYAALQKPPLAISLQ